MLIVWAFSNFERILIDYATARCTHIMYTIPQLLNRLHFHTVRRARKEAVTARSVPATALPCVYIVGFVCDAFCHIVGD